MTCTHENWAATVGVGNIVVSDDDPTVLARRTVEVRVQCAACGVPLEFQGLPVGVDTHGPTISVDGLEARLVAVPKGEKMLAEGRVSAIFRMPGGQA